MQDWESGVHLSGQAGQAGSDFCFGAHWAGKCHTPALHPARSGQPKMKPEPIQCRHRRLLRLHIA
jgi:hypothetical protein